MVYKVVRIILEIQCWETHVSIRCDLMKNISISQLNTFKKKNSSFRNESQMPILQRRDRVLAPTRLGFYPSCHETVSWTVQRTATQAHPVPSTSASARDCTVAGDLSQQQMRKTSGGGGGGKM